VSAPQLLTVGTNGEKKNEGLSMFPFILLFKNLFTASVFVQQACEVQGLTFLSAF